jgi:aspartate/methionine/tyrosine aminotransferase
MSPFRPFDMERMMSKWENVVEFNLSESGVHPVKLRELVGPARFDELLDMELNYPQANGLPILRQRIAGLYPGASVDNVLVTVGCAEANYIALQTLLEPGDEMVVMLPNYMQIWGIGHNLGFRVRSFHLREESGWKPDLAQLEEMVSAQTRLIAVCNPNNPTGYILTEPEMDAIVAIADRVGAWLLADEVYSGAEQHTDDQTPSFWGRYDRVLAMNSLSKAYGLPGLRIGWIVAPRDTIDQIWARHEYTTISTTMLSNWLASIALSPEVRPRLIQRARSYIRSGYPVLESWFAGHPEVFSLTPPQAAAIAFVRYELDINSSELVDRLIHTASVLVVPGDHFGLDHHLRISFGLPHEVLLGAMQRMDWLLARLEHDRTDPA